MPQEYTTYGNDAKPYPGGQNVVTQIAEGMQADDNRFSRHVNLVGSRGTDYTLTADDMQCAKLEANWALTANVVAKVPLTGGTKTLFYFINRTSGAFSVTVKTTDASSTGVVVAQGSGLWLMVDGIDIVEATPARAITTTSLSTSLIASWGFNQNAEDSAGANDLTLSGSPAYVAGKIGYALQLASASSQYGTIADNADLSAGDIDFTLAGYISFDTIGANRGIAGKWGTTGQLEYFVQFETSDNKLVFYVSSNGTATASVRSSTTLAAGTGYFFRAWHDSVGNTINLQIDAGTAASTAHSAGVFNGTSAFNVGRNENAGGNFMNGKIDLLNFWKKALTTAEWTYFYNNGNGRELPF